jgi:hypothetical protein
MTMVLSWAAAHKGTVTIKKHGDMWRVSLENKHARWSAMDRLPYVAARKALEKANAS